MDKWVLKPYLTRTSLKLKVFSVATRRLGLSQHQRWLSLLRQKSKSWWNQIWVVSLWVGGSFLHAALHQKLTTTPRIKIDFLPSCATCLPPSIDPNWHYTQCGVHQIQSWKNWRGHSLSSRGPCSNTASISPASSPSACAIASSEETRELWHFFLWPSSRDAPARALLKSKPDFGAALAGSDVVTTFISSGFCPKIRVQNSSASIELRLPSWWTTNAPSSEDMPQKSGSKHKMVLGQRLSIC